MDKKPVVATIGFFDGVHKGHQYLLQQVKEEAKRRSLPSLVITFIEHPRKVLHQEFQPDLLCGYFERLSLLEKQGLDYCIALPFTKAMSLMSAEEFMTRILKEQYNVDTLVVGYDHRFGCERTDGFSQYQEYGEKIGMNIVQAQELEDVYVSSSHIRELLKEGKVDEVTNLLGYPFSISGSVVKCFQVARVLGFPTANIRLSDDNKIIPLHGVYAIYVYLKDRRYRGMLYVGNRPTLSEAVNGLSIEANIFNFEGDIYGEHINVELYKLIRYESRFFSMEVMKRQLQQDKDNSNKFFDEFEQL